MKVAVVNAMAPFLWGGAEELAQHLVRNLAGRGFEPTLLRIPFAWDPYTKLPSEMARLKALDLSQYDRVISMKFPIYLLEAEHHTTWLIHQYRQAYDLWGSQYANIPDTASGRAVRDLIIAHDTAALSTRGNLFTISDEITGRLRQYNGIEAPPLRAPINDPELFTGGDDGGYFLAPGRVNSAKRQHLAVEAMRLLPKNTRLVVAGPPEGDSDVELLRRLVREHDLGDRVRLDLRFLDRKELADYVNNARAVIYLPYQEDSFGYVTMEAYEAGKPVIAAADSGELLEIVVNDQTGMIVDPQAESLAQAMSNYLSDPAKAQRHGRAGRDLWRGKGINWAENISRLIDG